MEACSRSESIQLTLYLTVAVRFCLPFILRTRVHAQQANRARSAASLPLLPPAPTVAPVDASASANFVTSPKPLASGTQQWASGGGAGGLTAAVGNDTVRAAHRYATHFLELTTGKDFFVTLSRASIYFLSLSLSLPLSLSLSGVR